MNIDVHEDLRTIAPRRPISREKKWIMFVLTPATIVAAATLGTLVESNKGLESTVDVVFSIVLNILAFAWCRVDSTERGYKLHRFFSFATVIFGIFALIYYLFRSRGVQGGIVSFGWLLLYAILCFLASLLIFLPILIALVFAGFTEF